MKSTVEATYIDNNKCEAKLIYHGVDQCPRCKTSLIPTAVYATLYLPNDPNANLNEPQASVLNYCVSCKNCFITCYNTNYNGSDSRNKLIFKTVDEGYSEPIDFVGKTFPETIMQLSPMFIETYHQSENAEALNLTQIVGMGYRKALEFLVKDYAIQKNPDKKGEIESAFLSVCIKNILTILKSIRWQKNQHG